MTELQRALCAFWGSFRYGGTPLPAYAQESVPRGVSLPYLTFETRKIAAMQATNTAAIAWVEAESVSEKETALMEDFARAIPEGGARLNVPGGFLMLYRASSFLSLIPDMEESGQPGRVLGIRVGYEAHFYTM